jgi:hypothetical protein
MFPKINWSRLTHLKHLGWTNPSFDLFSCITPINQNLRSLTIQWQNDFIMDFALLLHFPNLQDVTMITTIGKYIHFEVLFQMLVPNINSMTRASSQLPKLKTLCCDMTNLSTQEKMLLSH